MTCRGVPDLLSLFLAGALLSILVLSCCRGARGASSTPTVVHGVPYDGANTALAVGTGLVGGLILADVLEDGEGGGAHDVGFQPDQDM